MTPAPLVEEAQTCLPHPQKYNYLKAPGIFEYPTPGGHISPSKNPNITQNGFFTFACEDIRNKHLPLDPDDATAANPRAPDANQPVVADMRSTLISDPSIFEMKNNGIIIVCDNINWDASTGMVQISIIEGDGIINGGHTYYSISSIGSPISDEASVKIELIELDKSLQGQKRKEVISQLAIARNKNRELSQGSNANYLGYYERWKDSLPEPVEEAVSWKQGDPLSKNIQNAEKHLIPFLWGMEFTQNGYHRIYNPDGTEGLGVFGTDKHNKWYSEVTESYDPLGHMLPMLTHLLLLKEYVGSSIHDPEFSKRNRIEKRLLYSPKGPKYFGPNSTDIGTATFTQTGFGKWMLTGKTKGGKAKTQTSLFTHDGVLTIPNTVLNIIMGNFRNLMWSSIDLASDEKIVGFCVDPFSLWEEIKFNIIGALLAEYDGPLGKQQPTVFIRDCHGIYFIDYMEWGGVEFDFETDFPEVLYYEGVRRIKCDDSDAEFWVELAHKDDDFFINVKSTAGNDLQGYKTH